MISTCATARASRPTLQRSATTGAWRGRCRCALRVCSSGRDMRKSFAAPTVLGAFESILVIEIEQTMPEYRSSVKIENDDHEGVLVFGVDQDVLEATSRVNP